MSTPMKKRLTSIIHKKYTTDMVDSDIEQEQTMKFESLQVERHNLVKRIPHPVQDLKKIRSRDIAGTIDNDV